MTSSTPLTLGFFAQHAPLWEKTLAHLRGKPDVRMLEIGSWTGTSACWLLHTILTHESSRLICVDIFVRDRAFEREATARGLIAPVPDDLNIEAEFDRMIGATGAAERVVKMKGRSQEILRTLPLRSFDAVYVDGSHLATDTLIDIVLSWDLLRDGGILIMDDDHYRPYADQRHNPRAAIGAFCALFSEHMEILHAGWQVIARKRSRAGQPTLVARARKAATQRPSPFSFKLRQRFLHWVLGL